MGCGRRSDHHKRGKTARGRGQRGLRANGVEGLTGTGRARARELRGKRDWRGKSCFFSCLDDAIFGYRKNRAALVERIRRDIHVRSHVVLHAGHEIRSPGRKSHRPPVTAYRNGKKVKDGIDEETIVRHSVGGD